MYSPHRWRDHDIFKPALPERPKSDFHQAVWESNVLETVAAHKRLSLNHSQRRRELDFFQPALLENPATCELVKRVFFRPEYFQAIIQRNGPQWFGTAEWTLSDGSDHTRKDHCPNIIWTTKDLFHAPPKLCSRHCHSGLFLDSPVPYSVPRSSLRIV